MHEVSGKWLEIKKRRVPGTSKSWRDKDRDMYIDNDTKTQRKEEREIERGRERVRKT